MLTSSFRNICGQRAACIAYSFLQKVINTSPHIPAHFEKNFYKLENFEENSEAKKNTKCQLNVNCRGARAFIHAAFQCISRLSKSRLHVRRSVLLLNQCELYYSGLAGEVRLYWLTEASKMLAVAAPRVFKQAAFQKTCDRQICGAIMIALQSNITNFSIRQWYNFQYSYVY